MMLPRLSKKNPSCRPPAKGHRGVLGLPQKTPSADAFQSLLPAIASAEEGAPQPLSLVSPAPAGPAGRELSVWESEPAAARTKAKERQSKTCTEQVETRRALRSLWPGDWDAATYLRLRAELESSGKWESFSALQDSVVKTSQVVLDCGSYRLSPKGKAITLPKQVRECWFGVDSSQDDEGGYAPRSAPPLVCAACGPLEIAMAIKRMPNPMVMTTELTDFSEKGTVLGPAECRSAAQRDLLCRTNLLFHLRKAEFQCTGSSAVPKEHMRAAVDPYIVIASDVHVFRGGKETGFPFLSEEDSLSLSMLVAGRFSIRPELSKRGEFFVKEKEVLAYMDRLNLFAMAVTSMGCFRDTLKPVLILSAHDLMVAGEQQPRHSVAAALASWRHSYAHAFDAVLVACGDAKTAEILDGRINKDVYAQVSATFWASGSWHWNPSYLDLSANPTLTRMAYSIQAARFAGQDQNHGAKMPSGSRRKSSFCSAQVSMQQEVLAGHRSEQMEQSANVWNFSGRGNGMQQHDNVISQMGHGAPRHASASGAMPIQPTNSSTESSREAHERAVSRRLREAADRGMSLKTGSVASEDIHANAGEEVDQEEQHEVKQLTAMYAFRMMREEKSCALPSDTHMKAFERKASLSAAVSSEARRLSAGANVSARVATSTSMDESLEPPGGTAAVVASPNATPRHPWSMDEDEAVDAEPALSDCEEALEEQKEQPLTRQLSAQALEEQKEQEMEALHDDVKKLALSFHQRQEAMLSAAAMDDAPVVDASSCRVQRRVQAVDKSSLLEEPEREVSSNAPSASQRKLSQMSALSDVPPSHADGYMKNCDLRLADLRREKGGKKSGK